MTSHKLPLSMKNTQQTSSLRLSLYFHHFTFFLSIELPDRGCSLSTSTAYTRAYTVPYFPAYKSTFQILKITPKNRPRLIHLHVPKHNGRSVSGKITLHLHNNRLQSEVPKFNYAISLEKIFNSKWYSIE